MSKHAVLTGRRAPECGGREVRCLPATQNIEAESDDQERSTPRLALISVDGAEWAVLGPGGLPMESARGRKPGRRGAGIASVRPLRRGRGARMWAVCGQPSASQDATSCHPSD
jgi:hypothetical protein